MASILLVDDEPAFRDIFQRYLDARGYAVVTAGSGQEALALLHEHAPELRLIVLDLILPGEDGRQIAAQIKAVRPGLPVLYVSANRRQQIIDTGLLNPEDDFLEKPFSLITLEQIIQQILSQTPPR